jgi:hypothetical protein
MRITTTLSLCRGTCNGNWRRHAGRADLAAFTYPIRNAVRTASDFGIVIAIPAVIGFVPGRLPGSLGDVSLVAAAIIIPFTTYFAPWALDWHTVWSQSGSSGRLRWSDRHRVQDAAFDVLELEPRSCRM